MRKEVREIVIQFIYNNLNSLFIKLLKECGLFIYKTIKAQILVMAVINSKTLSISYDLSKHRIVDELVTRRDNWTRLDIC